MEVTFNNEFGLLTWTLPESTVAYARRVGAPDEEFQAMIMHMFGRPIQMMMGAVCSGVMSHPDMMYALSEDLADQVKMALEAHLGRFSG